MEKVYFNVSDDISNVNDNDLLEYAYDFCKNKLGKSLDIPLYISDENNEYYFGAFYSDVVTGKAVAIKIFKSAHKEKYTGKMGLTPVEHLLATIRHELCHWYLNSNGEEHEDGSVGFERLAIKHDFISNRGKTRDANKAYQKMVVDGIWNERKDYCDI